MFQFRRFPTYAYLIQRTLTEVCSAGFPHSEICGSQDICSSPQLIAACHVLLRLLMPRHSPCALISLTNRKQSFSLVLVVNYAGNHRSSKIVIVTLFFHRSVPQLKFTTFLSSFLERPLCCLAFITFFIVQFSRCNFQSRLKPDRNVQPLVRFHPSSIRNWWR